LVERAASTEAERREMQNRVFPFAERQRMHGIAPDDALLHGRRLPTRSEMLKLADLDEDLDLKAGERRDDMWLEIQRSLAGVEDD
jgi:hypothetical protein